MGDKSPAEIQARTEVVAPTLESILAQEGTFVRRVLHTLGVSANDINDVAQEVLLAVHSGLSRFDPSLSPDPNKAIRAWVFGICKRQSARYRSRLSRRSEEVTANEELDERPDDGPDAEETRERREQQTRLFDLLDQTTPERRAVVAAHYLEGMSMTEVALSLGILVNTAWTRRRLGLLDLRAAWDREKARGAHRADRQSYALTRPER